MAFFDSFGVEYSDDKKSLLECPVGLEGAYTVLPGTSFIESGAFKGCSKIVDVHIPSSLLSIKRYAFADCSSLRNIFFDGSLKEWLGLDVDCFVDGGYDLYIQNQLLTDLVLEGSVKEIKKYAFYYCKSIRTVQIKEGITTIGDCSFKKSSISGVVYLPDSIKSLGNQVFFNCANLIAVSIPYCGNNLGDGLFRYCHKLKHLEIRGGGNKDDWKKDCGAYYTKDDVLYHIEFVLAHLNTDKGPYYYETELNTIVHYPASREPHCLLLEDKSCVIGSYSFAGVEGVTLYLIGGNNVEENAFENSDVKIVVGEKLKFFFKQCRNLPCEIVSEDFNPDDIKTALNNQMKYFSYVIPNYVTENPYRVLGVYSNASLREITANKTKLARYISVGKDVSFDADMNSLLPAMIRTTDAVEKAFVNITLPQDKIRYALTWFMKGNNIDEIALDYVKSGNTGKALEILRKKDTWSSLLNQGVLALAMMDLESAVSAITKMIHDDDCRNSFVTSICGDSFTIGEDELAHQFIDLLMEGNESSALLDIFVQNGEAAEDDDYIRKKLIDVPVKRIQAAIAKAKGVNADDGDASYSAGKTLMEDTKADLEKLKCICGDDASFAMIADGLARQILQCGINYYNNSLDDDYELVDKAMELQGYALQIAVGSVMKGRCKENVDILQKKKNSLPPKEVKEYYDNVVDLISTYKNQAHTSLTAAERMARTLMSKDSHDYIIAEGIQLIRDCAPHLAAIKERVGVSNALYLGLSTVVVNTVLSSTISRVNDAQDGVGSDALSVFNLRSVLTEAWRATLFMEKLDMESDFKVNRFNVNKNALFNIIERLHGFHHNATSSQLYVFEYHVVVDLDMRTEWQVYYSCKTRQDFETYLRRFPKGKYITPAKGKLSELENEDWKLCKTLEDFKRFLSNFPIGNHREEAEKNIARLEEDRLWRECSMEHTIDSYNKYLSNTKLGLHSAEARVQMGQLKEEQRKDEELWKKCEKKEDYENYLKVFPNGMHKEEGIKMMEKIKNKHLIWIFSAMALGMGIVVAILSMIY